MKIISSHSFRRVPDGVGPVLGLAQSDASVRHLLTVASFDEGREDVCGGGVVELLHFLPLKLSFQLPDALDVFFGFLLPQLLGSVLVEDFCLGAPPLRARLEGSPR